MSKNYSFESKNGNLMSKNYSHGGSQTSNNYSSSEKKDTSQHSCPACGKTYCRPSGVSNHKKRCKVILGQVTIQKEELEQMKQREEQLKELLKQVGQTPTSEFKQLKTENQHLREQLEESQRNNKKLTEQLIENNNQFASIASSSVDVAASSNNIANKSMSTLTYLMTFFKDAPPLKPITNLSALSEKYDSEYEFVLNIISLYSNGELVDNIGDFILERYKKKDINKQSLWNSDVSRTTYTISKANKKNDTTWVRDFQGIQVCKLIIRPVLEYIKPLLQTFAQSTVKGKVSNNDFLEQKRTAVHIISLIDNRDLEKGIIKYIAPYLYLNEQLVIKDTSKHCNKQEATSTKGSRSYKTPKNMRIVNKPKKTRRMKKKAKINIINTDEETDTEDEPSDSDN